MVNYLAMTIPFHGSFAAPETHRHQHAMAPGKQQRLLHQLQIINQIHFRPYTGQMIMLIVQRADTYPFSCLLLGQHNELYR